jgi:hypothetical protein
LLDTVIFGTDININNLNKLIILILLSFAKIYTLSLAGLNSLLGNKYNICKLLFDIRVGLEKDK